MSLKFSYRLFEQDSKDKLEVLVEKHLEAGWAFVGGGGSTLHQNESDKTIWETGYTQAMVLYKG